MACHVSEFDSAKELNAYVLSPENNLTQVIEVGGYAVRVTYRPTDLLVHQETEGEHYDVSRVNVLRQKYDSYYYFIVSLSKGSKEALHHLQDGMGQYSDLVETLSFGMSPYVTLTTSGRDTIPVGDFMLNRTYGFSQSTDLLFVFSREKAVGKDWVELNLTEFGLGLGNQRFRFWREDVDNVPPLNFESATMEL